MAIRIARLPEGTRVRVRQREMPLDPEAVGRAGTVVIASDYEEERLGVRLDGEQAVRVFVPGELDVIEPLPLPPERESAKARRALP